MPPEALTPNFGPTVSRINFTSSTVAPPVLKPVEVLTKCAPLSTTSWQARIFCSSVSRQVSKMTFTVPFVRGFHHVAQFAQNIFVVAVLEPADVEDDINFLRAVVNGRLGFKTFRVAGHRAEREADGAGDLHIAAFQKMARGGDPRAVDADAVKFVFARLGAEFFDVLDGGVRPDQGMVNEPGQGGGSGWQRHG